MMRKLSSLVIAALVLISMINVAGCTKKRDAKFFQISYKEYNHLIRWKEFDTAAKYVDNAEKFINEMNRRSEAYQMVDYEISNVLYKPGDKKAYVVVIRQYHIYPSVSLKKEKITQVWELRGKTWILLGPY